MYGKVGEIGLEAGSNYGLSHIATVILGTVSGQRNIRYVHCPEFINVIKVGL